MKKILCLLIACLSLVACGSEDNENPLSSSTITPVASAPSPTARVEEIHKNKIPTIEARDNCFNVSSENERNLSDDIQVVSSKLERNVGNSGIVVYLSELKNNTANPVRFDDVSIDLYDIDGNIISTKKLASVCPATLDPNESAFICEGLSIEDVSIEQVGEPSVHYSVEESPGKRTKDIEFTPGIIEYDAGWGTSMLGQLTNIGSSDYEKDVFVVIPIKNKSDELITVLVGSVDGLKAGETKGVDANDGLLLMNTIPEECIYSYIVCSREDYY